MQTAYIYCLQKVKDGWGRAVTLICQTVLAMSQSELMLTSFFFFLIEKDLRPQFSKLTHSKLILGVSEKKKKE